MRILPLSASANVTLDSNGNGTAQLGPALPGVVWHPAVVSVGASSNISEAQCKIYAGGNVNAQTFVDGTLSGSTGDSTSNISSAVLYPGVYIFAVWTGGDSGATATVNVTGTKEIP